MRSKFGAAKPLLVLLRGDLIFDRNVELLCGA